MGYACPVCDVPQRDAEHLANHLAFTALLRGADHEEWLDEVVPGWNEEGPDELAGRVVEYADEADYDEVFEDTAGGHDHTDVDVQAEGHKRGRVDTSGVGDEAAAVLDEARAYTREMYGLDEEEGRADDADGDADADDGA